MRTIQKGPEPASLTKHRQQPHADYDNYGDKAALRQALVAEQRGLCCYCQSRIRATPEDMKIEHRQCQADYPARQLDFRNLHGVCKGNEGQPIDRQYCDTRKGNSDLCFSVCDPAHPIERKIRFLGNGEITSDDEAVRIAINGVLNLNWNRLKENRKSALTGFLQGLGNAKLDHAKELPKWDGSLDSELPPFSQIVAHYLLKKLKRLPA
ncbi:MULTISPECIES: TIGR02646 family protein [unclassified Acidovorax]|uniref:TIGR02646 family protein n=1 Tax=unclassified Acidovorax TaxID=2684926 RepID=UPI001C4641CE|nr:MULTISPECIES: TIGR02646 family protein [unclassified Acidovorax]MBV7459049.1 TIGR02646 family protein [Acidovorax sp. sif0632]MBV7463129.1 TIGR02646 family protein [Acidovorax sp. sif0613]